MTENKTSIYCLEGSIGYMIGKTGNLLRTNFNQFLKNNGIEITPEQLGVMAKLTEREGLSQKELADELTKDKPNITRILDILEKKNYIKRIVDAKDRRKYNIVLTKQGLKTLEQLKPVVVAAKNKYEEFLTDEEKTTLKTILLKIHKQLNNNGNCQ